MKKSRPLCAVCASILSLISAPPHAALIDNGGGLIYDTVLDITWAQPDALRTWDDSIGMAASMTLNGVSGWRLPYVSVAAGAGPFTGSPVDCSTATELACRDNELGYMFYHNLSGTLGSSIQTSGDPDVALFPQLGTSNITGFYWSGTGFDTGKAWGFSFNIVNEGSQGIDDRGNLHFPWAVHAGNVGAAIVPLPPALWLFGSGLLGLIGISRRQKSA